MPIIPIRKKLGASMQCSKERMLTTHVGSLPRSHGLTDLILQRESGEHFDAAEFEQKASEAINHVVRKQIETGIDVINDGEQPRPGFSTYVYQRMEGFGGKSSRPVPRDIDEYQDFAELMNSRLEKTAKMMDAPQAIAEISYKDLSEVQRECKLFASASEKQNGGFIEPFMSAASPGIVSTTLIKKH